MKTVLVRCMLLVTIACFGGVISGCEMLPGSATLQVYNDLPDASIVTVNVSPTTSSTWGSNVLSSPIPAGGSRSLTIAPGTYDLRAVDSLGRQTTRYNEFFDMNATRTWTIFLAKSEDDADTDIESDIE